MIWVLLAGCSTPEPSTPPPETPVPAVVVTAPEARPTRTGRGPSEESPAKIVRVTINPAKPTAADTLTAQVDVSGAVGSYPRYDYVWEINGEEVTGAISERLDAGRARRGDKVAVRATLSESDPPLTSQSDTITIANQPPRLLSDATDLAFVNGYMLKAEDPDGEPLTWRIEGAPAGMTIDRKGILHYAGSPDEKGGTYKMKIFAEDAGRDFVAIDLPLTLTPGSNAVRKAEEEKKKAEEEKKADEAGK